MRGTVPGSNTSGPGCECITTPIACAAVQTMTVYQADVIPYRTADWGTSAEQVIPTVKYCTGIFANEHIYLILANTNSIGKYNPKTDTFFIIDMSAYRDYLLGNGTVFRVLLIGAMDTGYALSTWTSTADAGNPGFANSDELKYGWTVLAPNGIIYCIPQNDASIGMIDTSTDTFSVIMGTKYDTSTNVCHVFNIYAVLAPNGFIYIFLRGIVRKFNTVTHEMGQYMDISNEYNLAADNDHRAVVNTPSGKTYLLPYKGNVGIYNTMTDTYSEIDIQDSVAAVTMSFSGGVGVLYSNGALHSNGKIYIALHY